jgi:hypothetical protein
MKTDELIAELASGIAPVRPLRSPGFRAFGWLLVALAAAGAGVLVYAARPDIGAAVTQSAFRWTALLAAGTMGAAACSALVLAVPAAERTPVARGTTLALLVLWAGTLAVATAQTGYVMAADSHWPICFVRVVSVAAMPAVLLVGMLRRAAPLRPAWTAGLAFVGALSAGALSIQFVCPIDDAGHAATGHLTPVLILPAVGALYARRWMR